MINEEKLAKLQQLHGNLRFVTLPSGDSAYIREQNGDDDDVLSNTQVNVAAALTTFLSGICVWIESLDKNPSISEINALKLKDKYCLLMHSRVFSLGNVLKYEYEWDSKDKYTYQEDLEQYLWDYTKPFPSEEDPGYFKYRITPYIFQRDTHRSFTLSSGKEVRYQYLNGNGEKSLLELAPGTRTINSNLRARELEVKVQGTYMKVENFKGFSPRDMQELRKDVDMYDEQFDGLSEVENPRTGQRTLLSLLGLIDFFYPVEI